MSAENSRKRPRASRSWWAAVVAAGAIAGMGADRPQSWREAGLPPVTVAPDAAVAPAPTKLAEIVPVAAKEDVSSAPAAPRSATPAPMPARVEPAPAAAVAQAPATIAAPDARVYLINGLNLFRRSGFSAMVERIRDGGFPETRSVPWYRTFRFERDIRRMYRQSPGTPVVLIGYSFGTYRAKALANRLTRDGIPVAMVGYVGGDYLRNSSASTPAGVRVVNVTGHGFLLSGRNLFFSGTELWGAENLRLNVRHLDLPAQPQTVDALLTGIYASTGGYPATTVVASPPRADTAVTAPSNAGESPPLASDGR